MIKLNALFISFILTFTLKLFSVQDAKELDKTYHYYCTVADENHFSLLINLIGTIHKTDFEALDQIAVFDIGLNNEQKKILQNIEKVAVYDVEKTHVDLIIPFKTNSAGRMVRGWFAWKPVVLKQALELFPYILYLDAGCAVLKSPDNLFKHIKQNGYFLIEISPHYIEERITKPVIEKVVAKLPKEQAEFILKKEAYMIDAGFQGLSRELHQRYVLPMYKHSSDLTLFEDDGSSKMGFGAGRHDQTLFSIYAHLAKLDLNNQGWSQLKVDGKNIPFHMHWNRSDVNDQTCIYRSRGDFAFSRDAMTFLHLRKSVASSKNEAW